MHRLMCKLTNKITTTIIATNKYSYPTPNYRTIKHTVTKTIEHIRNMDAVLRLSNVAAADYTVWLSDLSSNVFIHELSLTMRLC